MQRPSGLGLRLLALKILATGFFTGLVIVAVALCSPDMVHGRPSLSAEEAKAALIELLRKDPVAFQRTFDWRELAKQPVIHHGPGRYSCGAFRISLPDATYQITVRYGCIFEYEGTFRYEEDQWIASKPHWTSTGLLK